MSVDVLHEFLALQRLKKCIFFQFNCNELFTVRQRYLYFEILRVIKCAGHAFF